MMARRWWEAPQLRDEHSEGRERRVSWLELFFDLVFVVVISQTTHSFAEHVTWGGLGGYTLLFIAIWMSWIGGTFYNERFEAGDVSYRISVFLKMLPVVFMAIFAHHALDSTAVPFALSYAAGRVLVIMMWLRGGWNAPSFRPVSRRYCLGFALSAVLFMTSIFVAPPLRFLLWGLALVIDLLTPMTTLRLQRGLPRFSESKLPERFGLFVIIVLGEGIVGIVNGLAELEHLPAATAVVGVLGIMLVFGLWWVYFDFIARRRPEPGPWRVFSWVQLHLPMVMALAAVGAAMLNLVAHSSENSGVAGPVALLLGGAVGGALIVMAMLELLLLREPNEPSDHRVSVPLKLAAGLLALAVGVFGAGLGAAGLLLALLPLVLVQMIYGAYVWFRSGEELAVHSHEAEHAG